MNPLYKNYNTTTVILKFVDFLLCANLCDFFFQEEIALAPRFLAINEEIRDRVSALVNTQQELVTRVSALVTTHQELVTARKKMVDV